MILPSQQIAALIEAGRVRVAPPVPLAPGEILPQTLQPASLDLTLGRRAYRMRASFLPGAGGRVADGIEALHLHEIDLDAGAVLETGCIYLIELRETLDLPDHVSALANPKSSTGRLDVFARAIGEASDRFDALPAGYRGPLWLEVAPRTFPVLVRTGDRLSQIRFRDAPPAPLHRQTVSLDLSPEAPVVGYRARRHSGLVDLRGIGAHAALDYWEPVRLTNGGLILEPEEFYILASREAVEIPVGQAAEMAPIDTEIGEFRAHYAGFFDPGFGVASAGGEGSRAVLEVRGRDVPFLLSHGQPVAHLVFEALTEEPTDLYGANGSSYQAQGLRLSKHFRD
ncbi:2'-deoxycytidine 5'-triphosphate deaminase [uncultured Algimonas sp.]|uniref:2'-deoxycytidine 5'-triphosphate deaminase domain-containing protein n=1 Tax=uncultured Algimonas sp. TaxID=1547920 RepID=UPI002603D4AF|nr:2'-deoxycytidine 5'-triphosphate deaminase [uncultured Algimonas sp.]